jgi:hypothetical protein
MKSILDLVKDHKPFYEDIADASLNAAEEYEAYVHSGRWPKRDEVERILDIKDNYEKWFYRYSDVILSLVMKYQKKGKSVVFFFHNVQDIIDCIRDEILDPTLLVHECYHPNDIFYDTNGDPYLKAPNFQE